MHCQGHSDRADPDYHDLPSNLQCWESPNCFQVSQTFPDSSLPGWKLAPNEKRSVRPRPIRPLVSCFSAFGVAMEGAGLKVVSAAKGWFPASPARSGSGERESYRWNPSFYYRKRQLDPNCKRLCARLRRLSAARAAVECLAPLRVQQSALRVP